MFTAQVLTSVPVLSLREEIKKSGGAHHDIWWQMWPIMCQEGDSGMRQSPNRCADPLCGVPQVCCVFFSFIDTEGGRKWRILSPMLCTSGPPYMCTDRCFHDVRSLSGFVYRFSIPDVTSMDVSLNQCFLFLWYQASLEFKCLRRLMSLLFCFPFNTSWAHACISQHFKSPRRRKRCLMFVLSRFYFSSARVKSFNPALTFSLLYVCLRMQLKIEIFNNGDAAER